MKFHNLTYDHVHKMEHKGHVGHKTGDNIVNHVITMLDDTADYKTINGKTHIKDIHEHKNGRYKVHKDFIPLEEHYEKYYPKIRNPLI